MSFADERAAIESRFGDQWTAGAYALWPVGYENTPLAKPSPPAAHVVLYVRGGSANQTTIGTSPNVRHAGVILTSVFTLPNTGTQLARQVADFVVGIFDNKQFSQGASGTITCRRTSIQTLPGVRGGYLQTEITTPYQRDVAG